MQWLFRLLTLIALFAAPLAGPAMATATVPAVQADCATMETSAPQHPMPADHHRAGESCCIAVPAGIDPALHSLTLAAPVDHSTFIAGAEAFVLGAGPMADDPPPRTA